MCYGGTILIRRSPRGEEAYYNSHLLHPTLSSSGAAAILV